jgi:hypothetical protein
MARADDVVDGISAAAGAAALLGGELIAAFGFGFEVGWFLGKAIFDDTAEHAKSRSAVRKVAMRPHAQFKPLAPETPAALNDLLTCMGRWIDDGRTARDAISELNSLADDADPAVRANYEQVTRSALARVEGSRDTLVQAIRNAADQLTQTPPYDKLSITRDQVISFKKRTAETGGLAEEEKALLPLLQVEPDELQAIQHLIAATRPDTLPPTISLVSAMRTAAEELAGLSYETLKSGGTGPLTHQDVVKRMLESKAVDFEAAGRMLAELGPQVALWGDRDDPWENFCQTIRFFFHIYRRNPRDVMAVEDLAQLRDAVGKLDK